jgi:hypothetical protein
VYRAVNRHNFCVQGSEKPHDVTEYEHVSPEVNVWCALIKNKFINPLIFKEPMVTGDTFLAMLENSALNHIPVGTVFQLHDPPFHFSHHVHVFTDR